MNVRHETKQLNVSNAEKIRKLTFVCLEVQSEHSFMMTILLIILSCHSTGTLF